MVILSIIYREGGQCHLSTGEGGNIQRRGEYLQGRGANINYLQSRE